MTKGNYARDAARRHRDNRERLEAMAEERRQRQADELAAQIKASTTGPADDDDAGPHTS